MAQSEEFARFPNRLINARSAYLRAAAYQPVGWYTFTPEAFEEARRIGKPILLDIGAAWCHWCHVMDRESYDDPEIATLINEHFIPIKVDRDEHPDIDARYQTAVHLLAKVGGWPLTVFLTPDGDPFFGGTYFPPEDTEQRVGMKNLLTRVSDAYQHRAGEMLVTAHALLERARRANVEVEPGPVSELAFRELAQSIRRRFNLRQGGFERNGPKFPHAPAIEFALLQWHRLGEHRWRTIFERTLTAMGQGGIRDQLGGGFHRYSTDAAWLVPHFEKMSYDNALLLENYTHAYRATDDLYFREVAIGILDDLLHTFADRARGGFFAAQDADNSPDDDGRYWTWTLAEFSEAMLPEDAEVLIPYFGVRREGNFPGTHRNVLHVAYSPAQLARKLQRELADVQWRIGRGKGRLLDVRRRRNTPAVDANKYANWNALAITACLRAGTLLGRDDATRFALRTAEAILRDDLSDEHGLPHTLMAGASDYGLFEDQAYMARALLEAFSVSADRRYLDAARRLLDLSIAHYWDSQGKGFFDTAHARRAEAWTEIMRYPRKVIEDLPTPSANAVAALTLDQLWLLTRDERYHTMAGETLAAFGSHAPEYGAFAATYGQALYFHLHPPPLVVIVGEPAARETQALHQVALRAYVPGLRVAVFAPGTAVPYPAGPGGVPVAYLCAGTTCEAPIGDPQQLERRLAALATGAETSPKEGERE